MEALARLDGHPNVVRVHEAGAEGGTTFFAMELVTGGSLRDRLRREGPLAPRAAAALAARVARALAHCHAAGLIHRDVKPENVLLDASGEPKLADLGLARSLEVSGLTQSGAVLGTPRYVAPELFDGAAATAASDIWALGVMLFELVAGEQPFKGDAVHEVAFAVSRGAPRLGSLRPEVPAALDAIVARALAASRSERYASAAALARDLEVFVETGATAGRSGRSGLAKAALAGTASAAIFALGAVVATRSDRRGSPPDPAVAVAPPTSAATSATSATAAVATEKSAPPDTKGLEADRVALQRLRLDAVDLERTARGFPVDVEEVVKEIKDVLTTAQSFSDRAAERPELHTEADSTAVALVGALEKVWESSLQLLKKLDAADLDYRPATRIPFRGWRRAALLALFARVRNPAHPERHIRLEDLPLSLIGADRPSSRWAFVIHLARIQILYEQYSHSSPDAVEAALRPSVDGLVRASAEISAAGEPTELLASGLEHAGVIVAQIGGGRPEPARSASLARAAALLELAVRKSVHDPWRPELDLARLEFHRGHFDRASALLRGIIERDPADAGPDIVCDARGYDALAAVLGDAKDARQRVDAAFAASEAEVSAGRPRAGCMEAYLARALVVGRDGHVAEARALVEGAVAAESKGEVRGGRIYSPQQTLDALAALVKK